MGLSKRKLWLAPLIVLFLLSTATAQLNLRITAAEYFINTDPGEGHANGISVAESSQVSIQFPVTVNEGDAIYLRFRNSDGRWGPARPVAFRHPLPNPGSVLSAAEYFINTDPGEGHANGISVAESSQVKIQFPVTVNEGDAIYLRFRNSNGMWCPARPIAFTHPLPNSGSVLSAAEYFINTDPGIGGGLPVPIDSSGNINISYVPTAKNDRVFLRIKDSYGRWSEKISRTFSYTAITNAELRLKKQDGTTDTLRDALLQHSSDSSAFYTASITVSESLLTQSLDSVFLRFQNTDYFWSPGIGALIKPLKVDDITPNSGGNDGIVTVTIRGRAFEPGARVKLSRLGYHDISADTFYTRVIDSLTLRTLFVFSNHPVGVWDVVVQNPGGEIAVLKNGFTLEPAKKNFFVTITGSTVLFIGHEENYQIAFGNAGNVDTAGIVLWISGIPPNIRWSLDESLKDPPPPHLVQPQDLSGIPLSIETEDQRLIPIVLPVVRAGETGVLNLRLYTDEQLAEPVTLTASLQEIGSQRLVSLQPAWESSSECGWSVIKLAWNITHDIPCVGIIADIVDGTILASDDSKDATTRAVSWTKYFATTAFDVLSCVAPKLGFTTKLLLKAFSLLNGSAGVIENCSQVPNNPISSLLIRAGSYDPNDKYGPSQLDTSNAHYVSPEIPFNYTVNFENVGGAPAESVIVRDSLDVNLDWDSFAFGQVSHPNILETLRDSSSRVVTWRFSGIQLPPSGGLGFVRYSIKPKQGLPSGTIINNKVGIVFDINAPKDTFYINTIDAAPPVSRVLSLQDTTQEGEFTIRCTSIDDSLGSGVHSIDIFVKSDSGSFIPWLRVSHDTETVFVGSPGRSYSFYSLARDSVGHIENKLPIPEATTYVKGLSPPLYISPRNGSSVNDSTPTLTWSDAAGDGGHYELQYSADSNFVISTVTVRVDTAEYVIPDSSSLTDGIQYWRLKSIDKNGNGSLFRMPPHRFIVKTIGPAAPNLLLPVGGSAVSDSTPLFAWSSVGTNIQYSLFISPDSGFSKILSTYVTSDTTLKISRARALASGLYYWGVEASDIAGNFSGIPIAKGFSIITSVRDKMSLPKDYHLFQNYPNPFNPTTTIRYELPTRNRVILKIYNLLGQEVRTLVDDIQEAGQNSLAWNGVNNSGVPVSSGVYFYRLQASSLNDPTKTFTQVKKMVVVR